MKFIEKLQRGIYLNCDQSFRQDAIAELCDTYHIDPNHPKLDKLFDIAWQLGHSSGHHEVWLYMKELVELL